MTSPMLVQCSRYQLSYQANWELQGSFFYLIFHPQFKIYVLYIYIHLNMAFLFILKILGNVNVADDLAELLQQPWHKETTMKQVF